MDYRMLGDIPPTVEVRLQAGEAMCTQFEGMAWMSDGSILGSNVKGGLMKGLGRIFSGEPLFVVTYTVSRSDSIIALASTMSGKVLAIDTTKTNPICQKGAFLCAQTTAEINTVLARKFMAGFFDREGFILQQIQGSGMTFLEVDGDMMERVLAPGEVIRVDTRNVFALEPSVSYGVETMKGVKNILFRGEGLFLTKPTGPDKTYMQIVNTARLTERITQGFLTSK